MSRLPIVLLLLSAPTSPAWSAPGPDYHGMIEVDGEAAGCVLTPGPRDGQTVLTRISWGPEEKRRLRLRARFPLTETWKRDIGAFAVACRRQGYNAARLHWLGADLAGRADADGQRLNPRGLDLYDRTWAELKSASVSAAITVAALDDATVAASSRLLLVLAKDARNSGEAYDADNPAVLRAIGTLPVLLRTGRFQLAIRRAAAGPALQAWTLAVDGTRLEPAVVEDKGDWLRLNLDTARLSKGPTPFVEFAAR